MSNKSKLWSYMVGRILRQPLGLTACCSPLSMGGTVNMVDFSCTETKLVKYVGSIRPGSDPLDNSQQESGDLNHTITWK